MHRALATFVALVLLLTTMIPSQVVNATSTKTSNETEDMTFYPFEGDVNSIDGQYNGIVSGTPAYEDGQVGQAIHLNGKDAYVKLPADHSLANYSEITVAAWVNWEGGKDWQRIFDFGNGTEQYMFLTPKAGNFMRFVIKNGGNEQIVQTNSLALGQWAHVSVTLGDGKAKIYVNGELKATNDITITPGDFKPGVNYIGKSQFSADALYSGLIDEFQIYNRALDEDAIKTVYNDSRTQTERSSTQYPLDENVDSADGTANGTVSGTPSYTDGVVGKAISLNGTDAYVTLPSNRSLSASDEMTISAWVNWKGGKDWQRIFDFGTGTNQYMFLTPKTGNNMRFAIKNGNSEQMVQTTALPVNQWTYVAVTLGSGKATLYVNGKLQTSSDVSIKPSDIKPSLNYIGKSQFEADALFSGLVDEFHIYNYQLSETDILTEYKSSNINATLGEASRIIAKGQQYYSDETWNHLLEVYERTKALVDDSTASHEAIDKAVEELITAIQNLAEPLPIFINNTNTQLAHPAISVAPDELLRVRQHIQNKEQPWYDYYTNFAKSEFASKSYAIRNDKNPNADLDHLVPNFSYDSYNTNLFNNQMTQDATAAYYQSIMYFMTGDYAYREKALRIIKLWSDLDPSKAKYVTDAHIHQGRPMYYMNAAAELLRYTSSPREELKWKDEYSQKYSDNFQKPALRLWMENKTNWMNQHQTSVMGTLSSYVFMDSREDYERVLEWATVNASTPAEHAYHNGAIANAMFEFTEDSKGNVLDEPVVAVKEMVRDQPHSYDNVINLAILADIISAQGTLLDPVKGTATKSNGGVDVYSFLGDRLLKGTNFYYKYNLGYDVPFNDGKGAGVSADRRGRLSGRDDFYYIYKYGKGYTDDNPDFKYLSEALNRYWDVYGLTVNDAWLDIPDGALGTAAPEVVDHENGGTVPYELEKRYTPFDDGITRTEQSIRVETKQSGAQMAVYGLGLWRNGDLALRIKSNGLNTLSLQSNIDQDPFTTVKLPDTGGEWQYVIFNLANIPDAAFQADSMIYFNVSGEEGGLVELDHLLLNSTTVKAPLFKGKVNSLHLDAYSSSQIRYDISNPTTNSGQNITYSIVGDSGGFVSDSDLRVDEQGILSANLPASISSGDYSFYVTASNGTAVNVLTVTVTVTGNYSSALENVTENYDPDQKYETPSYLVFHEKYDAAKALVNSSDAVAQYQALLELKEAAHGLRLLNPLLSDGALDLSGIAIGAPDSANLNPSLLVDFLGTGTGAIWIAGNKMFTIDFGEEFRVKPSSVTMMPDMVFPARSEGAIILASNDYVNWVAISEDISELTTNWTTYTVKEEYKNTGFRYYRMKDVTAGVLNKDDYTEDQPFVISELHIFGDRYETGHAVNEIQLNVQNTAPVQDILDIPPRAVIGDKVILSFKADSDISNIKATIQGEPVNVTDNNDGSYTAEYVVHAGSKSGYAAISIDYDFADGTHAETLYSYPEEFITNMNDVEVGQKVLISNTSNEINVATESLFTGSDNTLEEAEKAYLFDGKISTFADVRAGGSGYGYYSLDFGAQNSLKKMQLERFEILNRSGLPARASAVSISASVDGVTWRTITEVSKFYNYDTWQSVEVMEQYKDVSFRYFRINGGNWFGNISELRLFGEVGEDLEEFDPTYTITTTTSDPEAGTTLVYVNPNGLPPAPEPSGEEGTTLTVNGDQTAVTVVAKAAPGYEFVKWVETSTPYEITADYLWTEYPKFNLTTYAGGYLGGAKFYNVVRDWNLKAVFRKTDEESLKLTTEPAKPDGKDGWYISPVTLTLSTEAQAETSLDNGNTWEDYSAPIVLDNEGIHQVLYRTANSKDETKSLELKIDLTAPEVAIDGSETFTIDQKTNITWSTKDDVSSVTDTTYNESLVNVNAYTLNPGIHTLTIEAEDAAGHRGFAEYSFNIVATFESLSALTGTFAAEAEMSHKDIEELQQQLNTAKLKAEQHKGEEARQVLQTYISKVNDLSGNVFESNEAEILVRWAQWLHELTPLASSVPGKPVLSSNNGHEYGIKDGNYTITTNLWWGNNGTTFKLYENGVLIQTETLADHSPAAQLLKTEITGKENGTYTYTAELTNNFGTTTSDPLVVSVTDASPGVPVLSHDNWDEDDNYVIAMNLWWGTNGSEYRLFENDVLIDTQSLNKATPNAQKASTQITGNAPGVYKYRAELINSVGETSSETITVTVK